MAVVSGGDSLTINWQALSLSTILGYRITYYPIDNEDLIQAKTFYPDTSSYTINGLSPDQRYMICVETLLNTTASSNVLRSCEQHSIAIMDTSPNIILLVAICVGIIIVVIVVFSLVCIVMKRQNEKKLAKTASQRTLLTDDGGSTSVGSSMSSVRKTGMEETSFVDAPMPVFVRAGQVKLLKGTGKLNGGSRRKNRV